MIEDRRWRKALGDAMAAARFLAGLPAFLRRPVRSAEARERVRARFAGRERDFLALVSRTIYSVAASPYRRLLHAVGCELGDLEALVRFEGVEGALRSLFRRGVFLTVEEFKGRRPVVRGSTRFSLRPADLANPAALVHFFAHSSGSRGPRTPVPLDLAFVREHAVNRRLSLEARSGLGWRHAVWGVPGGGEMAIILRFAACGAPPVHWFTPVDPAAPGLPATYRWSGRAMRWGSLLAGVPLPSPHPVPLDAAVTIARWMRGVLDRGGTPHLKTFASLGVRLCEAARDAGLSLEGARFTLTGEPLTAARVAAVARVGAQAAPDYGTTESGQVGEPCVVPAAPDDLHACDDLHALIQPGADGAAWGLPPRALLLSSLRATARLILLNVSMGDEAELEERACGCPMERDGWRRHLHAVRSFEKLTGAGMTFLDADAVRLLEEVLPARFGGVPSHYQLVEDEASDGTPRLRLVVDPAVGPLDARAVSDAFLAALGAGSAAEHLMELLWREAGIVRIERATPRITASGKILHLHRENGAPPNG